MRITGRKYFILLVIAAGFAGLLLFLYPLFSAKKIKNVILISIDTCRADYLSCYEFPLDTTPTIDAIAQEGMLFKQTVSPVPFTLPAHCSMLTGKTPPYHGVLDNGLFTLDKDNLALAEILKERGFVTGAFVSSYILDSKFGMDQGFDTYNDDFVSDRNPIGIEERRGAETTDLALHWIEKNQGEKQFLFVHYYDPHLSYDPPAPFDSKFTGAKLFKDLPPEQAMTYATYAGEIAYVDHCIGRIVAKLKDIGQYESTLICITSDHGEMLGEHGERTHGYFVYQGNIHVPLVFKVPGRQKALKIQQTVGLVDIMPTICSALGIAMEHEIQGKDLLAYGDNDNPYPGRYLFSQSLEPTKYKANPLLSVISDRYKYIQTTRPELYDFQKDPYELKNLIQQEPKRARLMEGELLRIVEDAKSKNKEAKAEGMDAETVRKLASLGYVGSKIEDDFLIDPEKDDPKDIIEYHVLSNSIGYLTEIENYELAEKNCRKLIEQKPDLYMGYYKMARYLEHRKEYAEVIDYLLKVIELEPDFVSAYVGLAEMQKNLGHYDLAIDSARKALELEKDSVDAYRLLSESYYEQGLFDEPEKDLTPEIAEHSGYPNVLQKLAMTLYLKGQIKRSYNKYSELVKLDPDSIEGLNGLAWFQAASTIDGMRNPQEGMKHAMRACELSDFAKAESIDTLAVAYAAAGKYPKAVETAQKAIEVARSHGEDDLAGRIQKRQDLYKQGKMYVDAGLK